MGSYFRVDYAFLSLINALMLLIMLCFFVFKKYGSASEYIWFLVFKKYATIFEYLMLSETFMYFWLIYSDRNNHMERIAIAVKNVVNCCVKSFFMASEILE